MKKTILSTLFVLCITNLCFTRVSTNMDSLISEGKKNLQNAVDIWNVQQLIIARNYFEQLLNSQKSEWLVHYYIGYADWRIVGYYFSLEDQNSAKQYVDDGIEHLEKAVELNGNFADSHALLSSMLGNKIAIKPILGMTLGMKSGSYIKKAFNLEPENPRVSLIAGMSAYYTPKIFGGGKKKALNHLQKAVEYFKSFYAENPTAPTWGEEDTYTYLGLINMELENYDESRTCFEKVLKLKPEHGWIKNILMKELETKIKNADNK